MTSYPAFVRLARLLGRSDVLAALELDAELDPAELSEAQRARLQELVDAGLDGVAVQLVDEAAASDDVADRAGALSFVVEQVRGFGDLLAPEQARRLLDLAEAATADWG